jgi:hypothetical protein
MTMTPAERRAKDAERKRLARARDRAELEAAGLMEPRRPPMTPAERRAKNAERMRGYRSGRSTEDEEQRAAWLAEVRAKEERTGRPYWWPEDDAVAARTAEAEALGMYED